MNRKRFAFSIAIVAALIYPAVTGSWGGLGDVHSAVYAARTQAAEEAFFAEKGTTRQDFMKEVYLNCQKADREGKFEHSDSGGGIYGLFPSAMHDADFRACTQPLIAIPQESVRSYSAGLLAAISTASRLAIDLLVAAVLAFLLAFLAPSIAARYWQWVKAE